MSEEEKDGFRQDETSNLQKSENPDAEYMSDHGLCRTCHGVKQICSRTDCPQARLVGGHGE